MKVRISALLVVAAGFLCLNNAVAEDIKDFDSAKKLMTDKGLACAACHQLDKKGMGPSFNAIALFYNGKADAPAALEKKIMEGSKGVWGAGMMPPNPAAKDVAGDLVKWMLSLNPEGDAKADAEAEITAMPES